MTKTRQQAIAEQKNPVIRRRLEKMTDEQYTAERAKLEQSLKDGPARATVNRLATELIAKTRR
jgi:hypothetical protein